MFSKILIANRGEIAVRVIRACKEMGISSVAVYSEADRDALHRILADESYCIGEALSAGSYLNEERIISAALVSGAQAIHPGCGFLSENAHFAGLCRKNGIAFIGPDEDCMRLVSDKAEIKSRLADAAFKTIPGSGVLKTVKEALSEAEKLGYPVLLKSCCGGGGRGIRKVNGPEEMQDEYLMAVSESKAAFGENGIYIEKYIFPAKHIEVQIIADEYGKIICLGERDCSVQKKHQKLIEESPSPAVDTQQRTRLEKAVAEAAKSIGYTGAGTFEFLMDKNGEFWFMEINARLQVEHGVSEMLTGVDIVKWQIRTAAGIPLDINEKSGMIKGSSIECRINALSPGKAKLIHVPGGPFVRFDTGLTAESDVSPFYDPLLGKLIVYAGTREEAIRKMRSALCELVITGVPVNTGEQLEFIGDPAFIDGTYDLRFTEGG